MTLRRHGSTHCEVCQSNGPDLMPFPLEARTVTLCRRHAARAREANVRNLTDLRRLFVEATGRRSLIGRRSAQNRRELPERPEGRRLHPIGRRGEDLPSRTSERNKKPRDPD